MGSARTDWKRIRASTARIIFDHDTPAAKAFDVVLIIAIIASVAAVMAESMAPIRARFGGALITAEWVFTALFTVEYALRLATVERPLRYARSFFGLIDLMSILPTYLSLFLPGTQYLLVIRVLRVLRVFRILKLVEYVGEGDVLIAALRASRRKVLVFIAAVLTITVILGALMYLVEARSPGFTSVPRAIYWTIVTITTVGYGDISPQTPLGQTLAAAVMLLGYAIFAVPTGIVTVELTRAGRARVQQTPCHTCHLTGHDNDALYCKRCGTSLTARPAGQSPASS
jgi:voltage-gated potassium channel